MASFKVSLKDCISDEIWKQVLWEKLNPSNVKQMEDKLTNHYCNSDPQMQIFPDVQNIFRALNMTPLKKIKVVIVGQDPYHNGQATGLAFSVSPIVQKLPRSLQNIFQALKNDIPGFENPTHGCLDSWAINGVLLLNSILTVRKGCPKSHIGIGWLELTDAIIKIISTHCDKIVFLLLGEIAHGKQKEIDEHRHTVILAAHPSPHANSTFLESHCFKNVNDALATYQKKVEWNL